jgi:hypothetical protein
LLVKLHKKAQWGGKQHKAANVYDVPEALAQKLIARGYAEEYVPVEPAEDADAAPVCE